MYLFSKVIKKDDIIILNSGGHGFKVIETVEMIEVKQGPYNIKSDKKVDHVKLKSAGHLH